MKAFFSILTIVSTILSYAQCNVAEIPNNCAPLKTTGSKQLDKFISKEIKSLEKTFSINVEFYPYDDNQNSSAYITNKTPYTITIGKKLLIEEYSEANGDFGITAILAHQFGHIIQIQKQETLIGKKAELHADYLTGWYLGKIKGLTLDQISLISIGFWDKKDENYFSEEIHGTSDERKIALMEGYNNASLDISNAYKLGIEILKNSDSTSTEIEEPVSLKPNSETLNECNIPNPIPIEIAQTFKINNELYFQAKFEECAMQYNNLISKYPDYCIAYFNRGLALYYSGQYEKAKLDFQKSFELGFLESKIWMEKIK